MTKQPWKAALTRGSRGADAAPDTPLIATGGMAGTAPALLVFAQDPHGSAYLVADAKGNVVTKYPRTPPPTT